MSLKNWGKFWYLGLVWGATFLWLKIAIREVSPLTVNAFRLLISLAALFLIARIYKVKIPLRERWRSFLFLGVFNIALPFVLITVSEQYITSGMASILNSTVPFFTFMLLPMFVPDEPVSPLKVLGLVVGFIGVVVLVSNDINGVFKDFQWGALLVLAASLSYAVAAVFARRVTFGMHPSAQALGQNLFANLAVWPLALALEAPLTLPRLPMAWISLLWLGIMATAIGTTFFYSLLNQVGATRTTLTTYIFPLVGVLLGVLFLNESVDWRLLAGGSLVIAGVAIVNTRFKGFSRTREAEQS
ncbi:MAG: DMT family transporter [Bellilinea sp.]